MFLISIKNIKTLHLHKIFYKESPKVFTQFNFKIMQESEKLQSRKKFLLWSATALSSLSVLKFFKAPENKKTNTVKMLTQDGKLVEVNAADLPAKKKKITNEELQNWIKQNKV